jgi:uncharacterized protein (DUF4213/DUF364 family)
VSVLDTLLAGLPDSWRVVEIYVGVNWTLSIVVSPDGKRHAGIASTPRDIAPDARYQPGSYLLDINACEAANLLLSTDNSCVAVALATINALLQPTTSELTHIDAADWLSEHCKDRKVAIFGRFPFIEDEVRPFAKDVYVFEQTPETGEYRQKDMGRLLPEADLIAVTASSIINHTVDDILSHRRAHHTIIMLGPSAPLTTRLFKCGIDALFGVRVSDQQAAIESVQSGDGFQKMRGVERVSLFKSRLTFD